MRKNLFIQKMKKPVLEHYNVYDELNTFYLSNVLLFVLYPMLISIFGKVEVNRLALLVLFGKQSKKSKGIASDKKAAKLDLIAELAINLGPAAAYFFSIGNMTLYDLFNFSAADLKNKKPADLIQLSKTAIVVLNDNVLLLHDAGITAASILLIQSALELYALSINDPDQFIKLKSNVTEQITVLDRATFVIVRKELKKGMGIFTKSNPTLLSDFNKIIKITHSSTRKRASKNPKVSYRLTILDAVTLLPLAGVSVKFVNARGIYVTDINGTFTAQLTVGGQLGTAKIVNYDTVNFGFTLTETGMEATINLTRSV